MWRDAPGFPGYAVSDDGRVMNIETGQELSNRPRANGYVSVMLRQNGAPKRAYVHRLVAGAFLGGCPSDLQVNHINFIRSDNAASNLEVVTCAQNKMHSKKAGRYAANGMNTPRGDASPLSKVTERQVEAIRRRVATGERQADVARDYGVCRQQVWNIMHGRSRLQ